MQWAIDVNRPPVDCLRCDAADLVEARSMADRDVKSAMCNKRIFVSCRKTFAQNFNSDVVAQSNQQILKIANVGVAFII